MRDHIAEWVGRAVLVLLLVFGRIARVCVWTRLCRSAIVILKSARLEAGSNRPGRYH